MPRQTSYIKNIDSTSDSISYSQNYLKPVGESSSVISLISGFATSSPAFGFVKDESGGVVQDAAADGSTKGIATFFDAQFDSSSGLITLDTLDGGEYS